MRSAAHSSRVKDRGSTAGKACEVEKNTRNTEQQSSFYARPPLDTPKLYDNRHVILHLCDALKESAHLHTKKKALKTESNVSARSTPKTHLGPRVMGFLSLYYKPSTAVGRTPKENPKMQNEPHSWAICIQMVLVYFLSVFPLFPFFVFFLHSRAGPTLPVCRPVIY